MSSERLIGKAKHDRLRNDLYWKFFKYDSEMPGHFIELEWVGYNDTDWWGKWSKGCDKREQGGRTFRINFRTNDVYEEVDDA